MDIKEIHKEKVDSKINAIKSFFEKGKDNTIKDTSNSSSTLLPQTGNVKHRISIYQPQLNDCKYKIIY